MEEKPIIQKEQIQDAIQISKLIIEKGLEGKKLSQVEDAEENRDGKNASCLNCIQPKCQEAGEKYRV